MCGHACVVSCQTLKLAPCICNAPTKSSYDTMSCNVAFDTDWSAKQKVMTWCGVLHPQDSTQTMIAESIMPGQHTRYGLQAHAMHMQRTCRKPYSVSATKAMGTVEMKHPAMGMKEQMNTKRESRPLPGRASAHIPSAVRAVLTAAIRACHSTCTSIRHCSNMFAMQHGD